jgi:hypothetical protein
MNEPDPVESEEVVEEVAVEAAQEPSEAMEEAEEGVDEGEESEGLTEADILARVSEYYTAQPAEVPQGGLTAEDVNRALDERMAQLAQPEAVVPSEPEVDQEALAFKSMLERAPEEEREALILDYQQMREKRLREEFEAKIQQREQATEQRTQLTKAYQMLKANVEWGIRAAYDKGGMYAAVAKEFVDSGDYHRLLNGQFGSSHLSQVLQSTPGAMHSGQSFLVATYAAKALVEDGYQNMQDNPQPSNGEPETAGVAMTTAIPAKASSQPKKKKKPTPDELYGDAIVASGAAMKAALPFLND